DRKTDVVTEERLPLREQLAEDLLLAGALGLEIRERLLALCVGELVPIDLRRTPPWPEQDVAALEAHVDARNGDVRIVENDRMPRERALRHLELALAGEGEIRGLLRQRGVERLLVRDVRAPTVVVVDAERRALAHPEAIERERVGTVPRVE